MMNNWKQRYSNKLIPIPKDTDQYVRHLHEHGWAPKGGIKTFSARELEYLDDHIVNVHDYLHGWADDREDTDPTAYFISIHNQVDESDHDHGHPDSGKPITGVEKRYTDD